MTRDSDSGFGIRDSGLGMLRRHRREASIALAIAALGVLLAIAAPGYFARDNLSDLFLGNMPVLIVALGATLVILTGNIDISAGSVFAICGVAAGVVTYLIGKHTEQAPVTVVPTGHGVEVGMTWAF